MPQPPVLREQPSLALSRSLALKDLGKLGLGGEETRRERLGQKQSIQRLSLSPSSAPRKKGAVVVSGSSPCTECFFCFVFTYGFFFF